MNKHHGSKFDTYLKEKSTFEEVKRLAQKRWEDLQTEDPEEVDPTDEIFGGLCSPPDAFDDEVLKMLQLTVDEASVCYKHECYLATIMLCGKIIETLLAIAFQALMGKPPGKRMPFGQIRQVLWEKGVLLNDSVDKLLDLIYTPVVYSGILLKTSFPTENQAKTIAGLTQEVINIIYAHFNDQTDSSESDQDIV